jgi:SAM-dependent methyltransferase
VFPRTLQTWRLLWTRYGRLDFRGFYAGYVNQHARVDPVEAVGGRWDEIGSLQFQFLKDEGLRPDHRLLDFGCGCLRGGLHFIRYLEPGHYFGVDISSEVIAAGRRFLAEQDLAHQVPTLKIVTESTFDWFGDASFDVVLAQSVFTHMRPADLESVFAHVPRVMGPGSVFYATCFLGSDSLWRRLTGTTFAYPAATFIDIGGRHGLDVELLDTARYRHPYGTRMLKITRRR